MKKWWATSVVVAVGLSMVVPGVAHAADKVIVVPGDFLASASDTRATGHYEVVAEGLHIYTEGATTTDKVAEYVAAPVPTLLLGLGEPSMQYTRTAGSIDPGFQLVMDWDADGAADGILVGEKVYNGDWWASNGSGAFVKAGAPITGGGSGSQYHGTLDQWRSAFPKATVQAFGFSLGSGVYGDYVLNAITLGADTYTFTDKAPDTTKPTVTCDVADPGPTFVYGSTSGVSATVADAGSGPVAASVTAKADTASVGNKTIVLTGRDNAGNESQVTCSYSVVAGAAAHLTLVSGSGQTAAVGTAFAQPVQVKVTDSGDNPVAEAVVTFGAPISGASGTFTSTTVTTDAAGLASVNVFANAKTGLWNGTARTSGVPDVVGFSLTNTPAPPKKADLRVTVTGPSTLTKGQTGTYVVTVKNFGPDTATDVVASAVLPCKLVSVTAVGGGRRVGSLIVWPTVASLASGSSVTYTVSVKATAKGSGVIAAAAASLRTGDPLLANNAAGVQLTVR